MSSEQKETSIELICTLVVSVPYFFYILLRFQNENLTSTEEIKFWAIAFLLIIPIRIISQILITIVMTIFTVAITGKADKEIVDERDKLIELKSTRTGHYAFALGLLISMIYIAINPSITALFIIMFISGFISELVEIFAKFYYYNKGV